MKKFLVFFFCGIVLLFSGTTVHAAGVNSKYFPKDIQNHWAYTQLNDLVDSDVLNGFPDNTIRPNDMVTRAEFVQMLVNAIGVKTLEGFYREDRSRNFADVPSDQWYYHAIHLVTSIGYLDGVDQDHFLPNRNVQRDEMAKMVHNVFQVTDGTYPPLTKHFNDIPDDYWAKQYIDRLSKAGLIDGYQDGSFKPTAYATRAEAATLIYNALHKQEGAPTDDFITNIVLNHEKDTLAAIQANNVQQLSDLNGRDTTGYYKELSDWSVSKIKSAIDQGFSVKVTMKTDPQVKVIEKSGWSATVQLNEAIEMTFQKGTFSQTTIMDTSDLLYLKRMPDGLKIYDQKSLKNPNIKIGSDFN